MILKPYLSKEMTGAASVPWTNISPKQKKIIDLTWFTSDKMLLKLSFSMPLIRMKIWRLSVSMIKVKRSCEITKYWDPCINSMYLVVNSSKIPFYEDHLLLNIQAFLEVEADHCCGLQMLLLYEWLIIYLRHKDGGLDMIYRKKWD